MNKKLVQEILEWNMNNCKLNLKKNTNMKLKKKQLN